VVALLWGLVVVEFLEVLEGQFEALPPLIRGMVADFLERERERERGDCRE